MANFLRGENQAITNPEPEVPSTGDPITDRYLNNVDYVDNADNLQEADRQALADWISNRPAQANTEEVVISPAVDQVLANEQADSNEPSALSNFLRGENQAITNPNDTPTREDMQILADWVRNRPPADTNPNDTPTQPVEEKND